jgi:hypothetical protein
MELVLAELERWRQRELNTKRPRIVSHHMIRQAHTGETVLVKRREMTGMTQRLPWLLG